MAYNPSPYQESRMRKLREQDAEEDVKYYKYLIEKIQSADEKQLNNFDKREYEEYYNQSKVFKAMADEHIRENQREPTSESVISPREPKRFESETPRIKGDIPIESIATPTYEEGDNSSRPSSTDEKRIEFLEREVEELNEISKQETKLKESAIRELEAVRELNEQLTAENTEMAREIHELEQKLEELHTIRATETISENMSDEEVGDEPPDSIPNELLEEFDF